MNELYRPFLYGLILYPLVQFFVLTEILLYKVQLNLSFREAHIYYAFGILTKTCLPIQNNIFRYKRNSRLSSSYVEILSVHLLH